jgi:hypothetical protein
MQIRITPWLNNGEGAAGGEAGQVSIRRPSDKRRLSHTHSQLRLARTHERIEIDVPVGGSSREYSLLLNLRYDNPFKGGSIGGRASSSGTT